MTGPTPYGAALATDHGAGAQPAVVLINAGQYIQAHPGEPVPQDDRDRVLAALNAYAHATRLQVAS